MPLRIWVTVAAIALGAVCGYWVGARQTRLADADGAAATRFRLPQGTGPDLASLPASATDSEARFEALAAKPIDDPGQALEQALRVGNRDTRRQQLTRIGWIWGSASPQEAWQRSLNVTDPAARWQLQSAIVTAWASQHPEEAFAVIAAMPTEWHRDQLLGQAAAELARRDPRLALEMLASVNVADPNAFQLLIADEWSKFDPAGAAQWIETVDRRRQARLAYEIADAYVAQQPGEALAWALRISRSPGRNLWSHMVGLLAQQNPQEALRLAKSADTPAQRNQAMGAVLRTIAAQDPGLAISYLDDIPAGPQRTHTSVQIALQMAETSPESALEWLGSLPDQQARSQGLVELGSTMVWEDVESAAQLLDRVPDDLRQWWIANVARAYVVQDVDKGIQWVRRFENDAGYEALVAQFASELAVRSPDAALELVERTADGVQRDQMLANMVMSGAGKQSPEIAARWIAKISDDDSRARAVEYLASVWGQYDLAGARKWVMSQPVGAARDRGLAQLAINSASTADGALTLIDQIHSHDQRMNAVLNTAVRLSWSNPEEARVLLRRQPLDPQHQQQLDMMLQQQQQGTRRR